MKLMLSLSILVLVGPASAAEPRGFVIYRAADLKSYQEKLAPKINAMKVAAEKLDDFGHNSTMVAHREGSGQVEIHEHFADLFVVVSGEATLVVGGQAEGAKSTEPGELRGDSIRGGERRTIGAGDIVHIPARVPHQVLLEPGHQVTYFVLKVETND